MDVEMLAFTSYVLINVLPLFQQTIEILQDAFAVARRKSY